MVDIYLITNKLNGKQYVGKTTKTYKERFAEHCSGSSVNTYIGNAIHKYGKDNFEVKLLQTVDDAEWKYWETFYIQQYHTLYIEGGYNLTLGGDSNPMDFEETREKHRRICSSDEHRSKLSASIRKRYQDHPVSEETRRKIRENNLVNLEKVTAGFRKYNDSRKIAVGIVDSKSNVIRRFESLADACKFAGTSVNNAGELKRFCDRFNKDGKRAKLYGYCWTLL